MTIRLWVLLPLAVTWALGSQAQTATPAKADSQPETKADPKAEAAAAMERAKRQAAGPMRVILEASKGKRRAGEAEPAAAPAASETSVQRPVAARPAPAPEVVSRAATPPSSVPTTLVASPLPAVEATAPTPTPAPTSTPTPTPATVPVPAPTVSAAPATAAGTAPSEVKSQNTLNSDVLQSPSPAPVPALDRAALATPSQAAPLAPVALPKVQEGTVKPKLVVRVDPELPQRLLDDLGRNAVVTLDISIRANGSVASVGFPGILPVRAQRVIAAAVQQWRFEPLPSDRAHRVELVFNAE